LQENPTRTGLAFSSGFRGERKATNSLNRGTAGGNDDDGDEDNDDDDDDGNDDDDNREFSSKA
jgi:hypothetical protein